MVKHKAKSPQVFVALLRGVNVGGKNNLSMGALKANLSKAGFQDVATYINSGNVLFTSSETDARKLETKIERLLATKHKLDCKVVVRSLSEMEKLVKSLPAGWKGDEEWAHNVMFLRHSIDSKNVLKELAPKAGIEKVLYRPGTVFWSARRSDIKRSSMNKVSSRKIFQEMTVRNPNTTRKLFDLMKEMAEAESSSRLRPRESANRAKRLLKPNHS
jgi:uncharacterized protein (DUF1697 family)